MVLRKTVGLVSKASNWLGPFARSIGRSQAKLLSVAFICLRKEQESKCCIKYKVGQRSEHD